MYKILELENAVNHLVLKFQKFKEKDVVKLKWIHDYLFFKIQLYRWCKVDILAFRHSTRAGQNKITKKRNPAINEGTEKVRFLKRTSFSRE